MKKKIISVVLVITMVLCCGLFSANAVTSQENNNTAQPIEVLQKYLSTQDVVLFADGFNIIGENEQITVFHYQYCEPMIITHYMGDYITTGGYCYGSIANSEEVSNGYFVVIGLSAYRLEEAYAQGVVKMEELAQLCPADIIVLNGDVNKDKALSIGDVTALQKHLALSKEEQAKNLLSINLLAADFNQDLTINIKDATAIQKKLAE